MTTKKRGKPLCGCVRETREFEVHRFTPMSGDKPQIKVLRVGVLCGSLDGSGKGGTGCENDIEKRVSRMMSAMDRVL